MPIEYSIIIPLKNEEGNIRELIDEVDPVMQSLAKPWELICIDDGSTDQTLPLLENLAKEKPYLRAIVFSKNYGQSSAFDAGFQAAKGNFIITLDGDRQNDPADIPKLIEVSKNYDLVCGIRKKRKDSFIKKITSLLANQVRSRFCRDGIQDTGCSLKLYRRECLLKIKMYHGMHRFLPALFQLEGFRVGEIAVSHRERIKGKTKYNFLNRSFNTVADMLAVRWMINRKLKYKIKREIS
ncbi:MAG: Undecaprenyl-phosphate 4-deoxy-4-formamido-L-arabinose transferase [Chlamydiae bacterium]|nr:Undecaprenyl-phosphate 4-deoxy-4-formamido-L-arabinose transferase [Chlamydiota bacterium]